VSTFPAVSEAALARKKAAAKIRKAAKKAEWDAEIARLRSAQARREEERLERAKPKLKNPKIEKLLNSPSFKEWFSEISGLDADEWVKKTLDINPDFLAFTNLKYDDMVRDRIFRALRVQRWNHPAYRRYWAEQIKKSPDAGKRRRITLRLATPKWADPLKMAEFYAERDRLTRKTGIVHHVDHIIPLQHPLVCGLNWEGNFQILTQHDNITKSNIFIVR
jgi:hypothetical protein